MDHVFLTEEQYKELLKNGSVTANGITHTFDPDRNIYYTKALSPTDQKFIEAVNNLITLKLQELGNAEEASY